MAISERLISDKKDDKLFMPMNVEGGVFEQRFINTWKVVLVFGMIGALVVLIGWGKEAGLALAGWVIVIGVWLFVCQLITRYLIFEEKYYYNKMYKKMKDLEKTTPAVFWDVTIRETEDGAVMVYSDLKNAIVVKLDRDTIIGKDSEFREQHFDAESDFIKEINRRGLMMIRMNMMEQAGKDPRLKNMESLAMKPTNVNLANLMQQEVGHIKEVTRATLYETDYVVIYTRRISSEDDLILDAIECLNKLLDGAYVGYSILNKKELLDLKKEISDVKYFDYTEATLQMYKSQGAPLQQPFEIKYVVDSSGEEVTVDRNGEMIINRITSMISEHNINIDEVSIIDALKGNNNSIFNKKNKEIKKMAVVDTDKLLKSLNEKKEDEIDTSEVIVDFDEELFGGDTSYKDEKDNTESEDELIEF